MPESAQSGRIVTRITITYRIPDDPAEHELTIEHSGEGDTVDAVTWNRGLMGKLAYREGGEYREPTRRAGRGEWKVRRAAAGAATSASLQSDCVWVHFNACEWAEYCSDM